MPEDHSLKKEWDSTPKEEPPKEKPPKKETPTDLDDFNKKRAKARGYK